jgi:hypothetical protein
VHIAKLPAKVLSATSVAYFSAGLVLLLTSSTGFYECPVRRYLGVYCPGCGSTHALKALFNGDIKLAAQSNLLFVLLPFFYAIGRWLKIKKSSRIVNIYLLTLVCLVATFTIVRNTTNYLYLPS